MPPPVTILVIDDEEGVLVILKALLTRLGTTVHTATSGSEGIKLLQSHCCDMVITDLKMPGMSGNEVLELAKKTKGETLPVVAMSGTPWLAEDSAFDAILAKPFGKKDLIDSIQSLIPGFGI